MKVIYIAGPYRAGNAWDRETNIRLAESAGLYVASRGGVPLIPHSMTRYFDGTLTDLFWLEATLELLKRFDAMFLVGEWEKSTGTLGEKRWCEANNIPVFDSLEGFEAWIEQEKGAR